MKTLLKSYFWKKQNYVTFLGIQFLRDQISWDPNFSGPKFRGDQKNQGPKWDRGPFQLLPERMLPQKWFHPAVVLDQQDLMEWFSRFYCFATRLGNDLKLPFFMARAYRFCLTAALLWSKSNSQFECSHMIYSLTYWWNSYREKNILRVQLKVLNCSWICPNVSTTPITAMGCWQCLPLSVVQLKGKVRTFWKANIIWKNLPYGFDIY